MVKAVWNGKVIAESGNTAVIEENHYFPPQDVKMEYLKESSTASTCPWKGLAHYYDVVVDGETNKDAAWFYLQPSEAAKEIKDHVAFWKGVEVG